MVRDNHRQGKLVRELAEEMVHTVRGEYELLAEETGRVNSILAEAASKLRRDFREIDRTVKENAGMEFMVRGESEYQEAYRSVVATLQFEDIVSQIVAHQKERAEVTQAILERMSQVLLHTLDSSCTEESEEQVQILKHEISACLTRFSVTESVRQQNLEVGETELF